MRPPRIQVLLDDAALTPNIRGALGQLEAAVELHSLTPENACSEPSNIDARLVVTSTPESVAGRKLTHLHQWFDRDPCATLVLAQTGRQPLKVPAASTDARLIEYAANLSREELAGRLAAMCGARATMDALRGEVEELRRQDQALQERVSRLDAELRLAGTVQKGLLPSTLPAIEGLDVHTWFRPAGAVSGDMYDVTRLDDTHVAFSLIDATGHGAAAGLLSAYVKRSFSWRALSQESGGQLEPDEVLRQLNRDLLAAQLQDCQFVAVLLAVFDEAEQTFRWARGGNPYPVLARPGEPLRRFSSSGPLVGISPDAEFEVVELALEPGDTLVFHTDGLEPLLGTNGIPDHADARWAAWFTGLPGRPISESLQEADAQLAMSRSRGLEIDDATVLVLQAHGKPRLRATKVLPTGDWRAERDSCLLCCPAG